MKKRGFFAGLVLAAMVLGCPAAVFAHCDTLDGPVVMDARRALENGDVTPALKWVKSQREEEVRRAFAQAVEERGRGPQAAREADLVFFETLVRIHREGEGAPYTGLKPAGAALPAGVVEADRALETGSEATLVQLLTDEVGGGTRKRFVAALNKKKRAEESVEAGREYVEAYVEFIHYVERLYLDAAGEAADHGH